MTQTNHATRIEDTLEILSLWIKAEHEAVHVQKKLMASICERYTILYGSIRETLDGAMAVVEEAKAGASSDCECPRIGPTKAEIVDELCNEFASLAPTRTSFHRDEIEDFLEKVKGAA